MNRGSIPRRHKILYSFHDVHIDSLRLNQPPTDLVPGAVTSGLKQQGREADHSHPFNTEDKNGGAISLLSHLS
jgi:hypothetical protein